MKRLEFMALTLTAALLLGACGQADNRTLLTTESAAAMQVMTEANQTAGTTVEAVSSDSTETESQQTTVDSELSTDLRILIAYFTYPEPDGVDTLAGASRVITGGELLGNTEYIAQVIQKTTGGEFFQIKTVQNYPKNHSALVELADQEKSDSARPELSTHIENLDDYDVIFLGYPNWWGELPMPLYTFLEEYEFSGKTVIPFNTHGGSRFSNTINTIAQYQPAATVITDGFTVSREVVGDAAGDVNSWLDSIKESWDK